MQQWRWPPASQGERPGTDPSLTNHPYQHFDFGLLALELWDGKFHSFFLSHPACGTWLQQPQQGTRSPLEQWFSTCGPWKSRIGITWDFLDGQDLPIRNSGAWGPAVRVSTSPPGDADDDIWDTLLSSSSIDVGLIHDPLELYNVTIFGNRVSANVIM